MKTLIFIGANGFIGKSFLDAFSRGFLKVFKIKRLVLISRNIKEIIPNVQKMQQIIAITEAPFGWILNFFTIPYIYIPWMHVWI